jgi:transcriptional regulator with XRE-family HTH domain
MDFETLLWQAIRRCESETELARRLGYNRNSIRQWRIGLALPAAMIEPRLAELAGVSLEAVRQAIREENLRRWDRARNRAGAHRRPRPPAVPLD